jgi:fucose permease
MRKFELEIQVDSPSHLTFFVPAAVSDDFAMFGYGIGIGPPGLGVLQTSGNAIVVPLLDACTTDMLLTPTVTGMG